MGWKKSYQLVRRSASIPNPSDPTPSTGQEILDLGHDFVGPHCICTLAEPWGILQKKGIPKQPQNYPAPSRGRHETSWLDFDEN